MRNEIPARLFPFTPYSSLLIPCFILSEKQQRNAKIFLSFQSDKVLLGIISSFLILKSFFKKQIDMENLIDQILTFKEAFFTLLITVVVYYAVRWIVDRSGKGRSDWGVIRSIILFSIILAGAIILILALPLEDATKGQISQLIGIVISAVLALSSATFMGNALAGVMLRTIKNFRPGDFIHTQDHFGRVTERGLFHTEIQTENRDLLTIPNLYLATNPVRTTRSSGTFISSVCSLGYDVNRKKIEKALIKAVENTGLKDGFVRITDLGDFSVVYKTFGLLEDVKTIISAESRLNGCVLDALHEAGIEIVSPTFMNQKQVGDTVFIPKKERQKAKDKLENKEAPENVIFDKADEAESIEKRKESLESINEKIKGFQEALKAPENTETKEEIQKSLERWKGIKAKFIEKIEAQRNEMESNK